MTALNLDRTRTAVLIMDYQVAILSNFPDADAVLGTAERVLAAVRDGSENPLIVYVVVGFRPAFPEVSANNKAFASIRDSGRFAPGDPSTRIHDRVAPRDRDVIVTKHRFGPFQGTDLEMVLRANGIDTLVLLGLSTSGVVLSTVRYAADADFRIVVVRDGCGDPDAEVHTVLMDKVFPRQAEVVSSGDVIAALRQGVNT